MILLLHISLTRVSYQVDVGDDEDEQEFDPIDLRTKRHAALAMAMEQPVFKAKDPNRTLALSQQQEQYPYVFDNVAKAKTAAGEKERMPTSRTRINHFFFRVHPGRKDGPADRV